MQLTRFLLAKAKSKTIMVLLRSTGSHHQIRYLRERLGDKAEVIRFDPWIGMECVYKEEKKIRSVKRDIVLTKSYNEDTYGIIPEELLKYDKKESENKPEKKKQVKSESEKKKKQSECI